MIETTTFTHEGTTLAATLFRPDGAAHPVPAVVSAQGFGNVKEVFLPAVAEQLAGAGIASLHFDYAGFGDSGGEPRQHVEPVAQLAQFDTALGHLAGLNGIDAGRIGVWGPSLAGGHVMRLAATDGRVRCALAMVPFVETDATNTPPALLDAIVTDMAARERGEVHGTIALVGPPGDLAVITDDDAAEMGELMVEIAPNLHNEVTLASLIELAAYRPLTGVDAFRSPIRVILAMQDTVNPPTTTRAALDPFEGVDEVELDGTHFSVFVDHSDELIAATVEWFTLHL